MKVKKLAVVLAAVLLLSFMAVPAMAAPSVEQEEVPVLNEVPENPGEDAPAVIIVDDDTPLSDGSFIGGNEAEDNNQQSEEDRIGYQTYTGDENSSSDGTTYYLTEDPESPSGYRYQSEEQIVEQGGPSLTNILDGDTPLSAAPPVNTTTVTAEAEAVEAQAASAEIAQAAQNNGVIEVTIPTSEVTLTTDSALTKVLADYGEDVTFQAERVPVEDVRVENVKEESILAVFELGLQDSKGNSVEFKGGMMTVTVPFTGTKGFAGCVVNGKVTEEYRLEVKDGKATFKTPHFSTWVLYEDAVLPTTQSATTGTGTGTGIGTNSGSGNSGTGANSGARGTTTVKEPAVPKASTPATGDSRTTTIVAVCFGISAVFAGILVVDTIRTRKQKG